VTVKGYYTANKYTLTYMVDGEVYKTKEVEYGSAITPEDEPEKEGYTFSGWNGIPGKMPAEDIVITGYFTKATYEISGATYEIDNDEAVLIKGSNTKGELVLYETVFINGKRYNVTVIGEGAFRNCSNITSITIPDCVESIQANAFEGCGSVTRLTLGRDLRYIGSKAFAGIGSSATVRTRADQEPLTIRSLASTVPSADADCFDGTDVESARLLVDDALVNEYKTTLPWSSFGTILGFHEATGISPVTSEQWKTAIFSIDGRIIDKPTKGISIIRTGQGTKKVFTK